MTKKNNPISDTVTCENCHTEVEVMFYPSHPGQGDPNQSNPCPSEPASHDPEDCPECNHVLYIETDADEMNQDAYEAAEEAKADELRDEGRDR